MILVLTINIGSQGPIPKPCIEECAHWVSKIHLEHLQSSHLCQQEKEGRVEISALRDLHDFEAHRAGLAQPGTRHSNPQGSLFPGFQHFQLAALSPVQKRDKMQVHRADSRYLWLANAAVPGIFYFQVKVEHAEDLNATAELGGRAARRRRRRRKAGTFTTNVNFLHQIF